eukprot:scaffold1180_cov321-Prasinococcus_capsulatus_cf.AAC.5
MIAQGGCDEGTAHKRPARTVPVNPAVAGGVAVLDGKADLRFQVGRDDGAAEALHGALARQVRAAGVQHLGAVARQRAAPIHVNAVEDLVEVRLRDRQLPASHRFIRIVQQRQHSLGGRITSVQATWPLRYLGFLNVHQAVAEVDAAGPVDVDGLEGLQDAVQLVEDARLLRHEQVILLAHDLRRFARAAVRLHAQVGEGRVRQARPPPQR